MTRKSTSALLSLMLLGLGAGTDELVIESDRFRLDASANRAAFVGNAVATIRSTTIQASAIEASYSPATKRVLSAIAHGDVRVVDGDAVLSAPRVEWDHAKRTVTLRDA